MFSPEVSKDSVSKYHCFECGIDIREDDYQSCFLSSHAIGFVLDHIGESLVKPSIGLSSFLDMDTIPHFWWEEVAESGDSMSFIFVKLPLNVGVIPRFLVDVPRGSFRDP